MPNFFLKTEEDFYAKLLISPKKYSMRKYWGKDLLQTILRRNNLSHHANHLGIGKSSEVSVKGSGSGQG
jgi:hypothetical protein